MKLNRAPQPHLIHAHLYKTSISYWKCLLFSPVWSGGHPAVCIARMSLMYYVLESTISHCLLLAHSMMLITITIYPWQSTHTSWRDIIILLIGFIHAPTWIMLHIPDCKALAMNLNPRNVHSESTKPDFDPLIILVPKEPIMNYEPAFTPIAARPVTHTRTRRHNWSTELQRCLRITGDIHGNCKL